MNNFSFTVFLKTFITFSLCASLPVKTKAQFIERLYGLKLSNTATFTAIKVATSSYSAISTMGNGLMWPQGESTFDDANYRYFIKSTQGILVIDALNGSTLDTINTTPSLNNIEYDSHCNCLVGIYWNGTVEKIASVNVATKVFTIHGTLSGVNTMAGGESTFDPVNRRYFTITDIGIIVVDSNRVMVDVIANSVYSGGLEYDPVTGQLHCWNSNPSFHLISINPLTHAVTTVSEMEGVTSMLQGSSTMDKAQGHYYTCDSYAIYMFDTQTGFILKTIPKTTNFGWIEYKTAPDPEVGIEEIFQPNNISVYPNPGEGQFTFAGLQSGCSVFVYNQQGQLVYEGISEGAETHIKLNQAPQGIYFYHITKDGRDIGHGKLLVN